MSSEVADEEQRLVYSSSLLFGKPPLEAMEVLKIRQTQLKTINHELAEWFTAYGRLRLNYSDEVEKLFKKGDSLFTNLQNEKLQNEKIDSLGLCTPMWSSVMAIAKKEADLFDASTRKMGRDMIAPLKVFSRQNDSNLIEMDDLSQLATKISQADANGENSAELTNEWSQRAPYFFEIFENYDYNRLLLLKDVFLKYQTDLNDVINSFKKENETGLEHVLSFIPDDEIKRYSEAASHKTFPIELIKPESKAVSKPATTTTDGFTSSPVQPKSPDSKKSHRRSKVLSFGGSSSRNQLHHLTQDSSPAPNSRQSSITSNATGFSSTTNAGGSSSNDKKQPKEKHRLRSRFGTILGRKKKSKSTDLSNNIIPESEVSSIGSTPITTDSRDRIRDSHGPNHYPVVQPNSPLTAPATPSEVVDEEPKAIEEPPSSSAAIQPSSNSLYTPIQTPVVESEPGLGKPPQASYPAMQPNKRTSSFNSEDSSSLQPSIRAVPNGGSTAQTSAPISASPVINEEEPEMLASKSTSTEVPMPASLAPSSVVPPPPPSSRKHVLSELSTGNSRQQSHGSAPAPPQQRKSVLMENSPPIVTSTATGGTLQPQETGSSLMTRNTTGSASGGLMSGQIHHPSLSKPGLNASIVELFNASFKDGKLVHSNAIGEVAFSYILDNSNKAIPSKIELSIDSTNDEIPNFLCNTMFIQKTNPSQPTSFTITDPSQIYLRTLGGLKYMLNSPTPPITIHPIWKHEATQSTVIISLKPEPGICELLSSNGSSSLKLTNTLVSVSIANSQATSAATKPSGSFNKEKNRVTWNLSSTPIVFDSSLLEYRFVARFMTTGLSTESESGVQLRFSIMDDGEGLDSLVSNKNCSLKIMSLVNNDEKVEDPFGSEQSSIVGNGSNAALAGSDSEWTEVPTLKTVVAGGYSGHA